MDTQPVRQSFLFTRVGILTGFLLFALLLALVFVGVASSTALAQESPRQQDMPNSWRYIDGERIYDFPALMLMSELDGEDGDGLGADGEPSPDGDGDGEDGGEGAGEEEPSFIPWSKTPEGFVNPEGDIIEGALRKGVDVSKWNGDIDWAKAKADGVEFAIIRCGFGGDYTDQDDAFYLANVRGCIENGIDFGIYLYSYAFDEDMARDEAAHVLRLLDEAGLSPADLKYPVYLDIEESAGTGVPCIRSYDEVEGEDGEKSYQYVYHYLDAELLGKMMVAFAEVIEDEGYEVGCYANLNWWNGYMTDPAFDDYERWVAQWNYTCDYEGDYSVWQYTSSGVVDGIEGFVDCNFDYEQDRPKPKEPAPVATYTVSASANPVEGGSVTGAGTYDEGTTATMIAVANDGYKFVKWTIYGEEVSTEASYSFAVSSDIELVAVFELDTPSEPSQPGDGDDPQNPEGGDGNDEPQKPESGDSGSSSGSGGANTGESDGEADGDSSNTGGANGNGDSSNTGGANGNGDSSNALAPTGDNTSVTALALLAAVSFFVLIVFKRRFA